MRFQALTDLTLPTGDYVQAGTTFNGPAGYKPPTNAVNPLDSEAVEAYRAEGPRGCDDAEKWRALFTNTNRWVGLSVPGPALQWVRSGKTWVLTGTGG